MPSVGLICERFEIVTDPISFWPWTRPWPFGGLHLQDGHLPRGLFDGTEIRPTFRGTYAGHTPDLTRTTMPKTGRPISTKTLAVRTLNDATPGAATKYAALIAARPHLTFEEYGRHLRQLAAVARAKVLRLCLLALAEHEAAERTMAAENAKAAGDAKRRAEIDRILAEAAQELEPKPEDPNANPSAVPEQCLEPQAPVPDVAVDGASSAPPAATAEQRAAALERGHELATSVRAQLDRCYLVPFNREEAEKLDRLQAAFAAWEKEARIRFPEIDTLKEFPDCRLRPVPSRITDERSYRIKRRTLTVDEQIAITAQLAEAKRTRTHEDSGSWGGAGPGI